MKDTFIEINGELFYKIENYNLMEDFFMTMTSSSDIWNFCWSKGGLTAGRIDCDHAIFPYYTADKVSDDKTYTGPYTLIAVTHNNAVVTWEPFSENHDDASGIQRNLYKNIAGTKIRFEEVNSNLELCFSYCWTSSAKYGLVRQIKIENLATNAQTVTVFDGCRNILPACVTADFQNNNSVLLDAYKKTELDTTANIAIFSVSSIVTDKAEPNEGLFANVSYFTTDDPILLASPDKDFSSFAELVKKAQVYATGVSDTCGAKTDYPQFLNGKRPSVFILHTSKLNSQNDCDIWYEVFDTSLDACKIAELQNKLDDRKSLIKELESDIENGTKELMKLVALADGIQQTGNYLTSAHHTENVLFNIMRGGIFANDGKIDTTDLVAFTAVRNKSQEKPMQDVLNKANISGLIEHDTVRSAIVESHNPQLMRLFLEYMPLTFSRRHGDPSRPWNRFAIKLRDEKGDPILNYEGNWRDIFQNWEALAYSYPEYIESMCTKFLNAMTAEGFNPYKLTRQGIDWEIPDPDNPWAQIGYWGDHQVIYFEKLLELRLKLDRTSLLDSLNDEIYSTSSVPYRLAPYAEILKNPRNTISFDRALDARIQKESAEKGSDFKLLIGNDGQPLLFSLATKLLQIIIAKAANFIPGGGIWLNTQRPEWNDANNALAGYGLSVVTLCYLRRFIAQLITLFSQTKLESFTIPIVVSNCFNDLGKLFSESNAQQTACDPVLRKSFADKAGLIFETERTKLYALATPAGTQNGANTNLKNTSSQDLATSVVSRDKIVSALRAILVHADTTIKLNRRSDGLYHAYNTMDITDQAMNISYLSEMLEGQVAVLSSGLLSTEEVLGVYDALKKSALFEERQYSYMLYPNKTLPSFLAKNSITPATMNEILAQNKQSYLADFFERTGSSVITKDCKGVYHFNGTYRNASVMSVSLDKLIQNKVITSAEKDALLKLYEKTFNHQSFTGRSGTFYAYEGLGSIYWHMVTKLLLAVQENTLKAFTAGSSVSAGNTKQAEQLTAAYYDIRKGIGFNKTPELYGAFPIDPYSHTPSGQGAKQPGMTGQVKEEILTRWGELGVVIENGIASFKPLILEDSEFDADGKLSFTWCGVPITYTRTASKNDERITVVYADDCVVKADDAPITGSRAGTSLTLNESRSFFARDGKIKAIMVQVV